jgi:hypothetical protein
MYGAWRTRKRFCAEILDVIEASERIVDEVKGQEVRALGVVNNLLEGLSIVRVTCWYRRSCYIPNGYSESGVSATAPEPTALFHESLSCCCNIVSLLFLKRDRIGWCRGKWCVVRRVRTL